MVCACLTHPLPSAAERASLVREIMALLVLLIRQLGAETAAHHAAAALVPTAHHLVLLALRLDDSTNHHRGAGK